MNGKIGAGSLSGTTALSVNCKTKSPPKFVIKIISNLLSINPFLF